MNGSSRSLYGVSYVPYKPEEKEKDKTKNPFLKASVIDNLLRTAPKSVVSQVLEKLRNIQGMSSVVDPVSDYLQYKDYTKLVSSVGKIDRETIKEFAKKYMNVLEKEELDKSLNLLKSKTEELEEEPEVEESEGIRKEIDKLHREIKSLKAVIHTKALSEREKIEEPLEEIPEAEMEKVRPSALTRLPVEYRALSEMIKEKRSEAELLVSYLPPAFRRETKKGLIDMVKANFYQKRKQVEDSVEQLEEGIYAGVLFLERMDFTPVKLVKGELVYTLPLTPGEKITVSHREWVKTVEEFEKELVTLTEEEQEKATTERTELAESTSKDEKTEHKFDTGLKVKGGSGAWSVEFSAGYSYNNLKTKHSEYSSKRNREITRKAASRSKTEHKLTFKISREVTREDEQVRVIENKSDDVVRWDFYRMMRKWRIDLYRVGERLTFDIVVPEPGFYLLRKYLELEKIQERIDEGFVFGLTPEDISTDNYLKLAGEYGVSLPEPPKPMRKTYVDVLEDYRSDGEHPKVGVRTIDIEFPEGYKIYVPEEKPEEGKKPEEGIKVISPTQEWGHGHKYSYWNEESKEDKKIFFESAYPQNIENIIGKERNKYTWNWKYYIGKNAEFTSEEQIPHLILDVKAVPLPQAWDKWRMECFEKIKEAERTRWLQELEGLENRRDRLLAELTGKDALKLRQIEKEEIMKTVLRWLIGPEFEFFPEELMDSASLEDLPYYEGAKIEESIEIKLPPWASKWIGKGKSIELPPEKLMKMDEETRNRMLKYLEKVRFIQQAIEWENVNWILYPYFWTVPERWDFKQSLEHPDFYHRAFLRAGCARVVLTVRPGFEEAFVRFMETGEIDGEIEDDHPYLTLAQEIKASSKSIYKYVPNPNRGDYVFCWDDVPGADEGRLKEHVRSMKDVILKDLPEPWSDIDDSRWSALISRAEVKKNEEDNEITMTIENNNEFVVVKFELDTTDGTIRLMRKVMERRGDVLGVEKEDVLPLRYYSSEEKEGDAIRRYVFFIPGEHIDTWYEYTPTGALHVEKGEKLSSW